MAKIGNKKTGPSFCWHCNRQLQLVSKDKVPEGRGPWYYFETFLGEGGNEHRVHGSCLELAEKGKECEPN